MLNLFRSNQLILGVFLLGYALILRFWLLFAAEPTKIDPDFHLLSNWLWNELKEPIWLPALATSLIIWIQALLINSVVARNRMATEINLFPGLFYILVCSALPVFQEFSPIHLANTFLIIALGQIYRIYKQNRCMDNLFNAGLVIGLASLFYSPYILFLLPILFGLNSLRAFSLREWMAVIIGGAIPLLWLLIFGFLNDNLALRWDAWTSQLSFMDIQWRALRQYEIIGLLIMAALIVAVVLNYNANIQKTIIEVRKKIDMLYWILFFGLVVTIFSASVGMVNLLTVALPCGILLSFMFTRMSRANAELVHLFLLIGVLVYHYLTFAGVL
ncbi:DUF6427 family protein [Flavilitoribacter nigricans]|uniref:DUF6427 family protein n=1 Tax=Flavilitoribacter nigricans TaxID=70997 RepID=UPI000C047E3D|nr:DUF6427 family protein [Flavilitoribacter nigricans]